MRCVVYLQSKQKEISSMKNEIININPLCDFGFKRIFGTEENKDVLISFLNACISKDVGVITDIEYLNTELVGSLPEEKHVIFDIYCTNQDGDRFIIEMQRGRQNHFSNRILTYVARVISQSVERGNGWYDFPNIYSFNILDFDAYEFRKRERFFWRISLKDDDNEIFSRKVAMYFVELRKFAGQVGEMSEGDEMCQWLYVLKNIQKLRRDQLPAANSAFDRVFELCNYSKLNVMEQEDYRKSLLDYEGVQDMVACTREEGYKKGLEEGIAEGMEKGKTEMQRQVARQMLSRGMDVSIVAEITGLSKEEVGRL